MDPQLFLSGTLRVALVSDSVKTRRTSGRSSLPTRHWPDVNRAFRWLGRVTERGRVEVSTLSGLAFRVTFAGAG